jgi:hypothetical protein
MSPAAIVFHRKVVRLLKGILSAYEEYIDAEEQRLKAHTYKQ